MKTHYVEVNLAIELEDDENVYEVLKDILNKQLEVSDYDVSVTSTHEGNT